MPRADATASLYDGFKAWKTYPHAPREESVDQAKNHCLLSLFCSEDSVPQGTLQMSNLQHKRHGAAMPAAG